MGKSDYFGGVDISQATLTINIYHSPDKSLSRKGWPIYLYFLTLFITIYMG